MVQQFSILGINPTDHYFLIYIVANVLFKIFASMIKNEVGL